MAMFFHFFRSVFYLKMNTEFHMHFFKKKQDLNTCETLPRKAGL